VADLVASPQYAARRFMATVDHPATGPARYPSVACTLDGDRPTPRRAPLLGQHNLAIYCDRLGLTTTEVVGLRERGVL
jgi:crotonobetainyl-CoA:carnitine CoA-transferase CaiB-like acyl-CoA transferase